MEGGDEDHIEHDVRRDDFAQRRVDRHTLDLPELRLTKQPYATPDEDAKVIFIFVLCCCSLAHYWLDGPC